MRGFSWFFWNSVKLSALNVLLLLPLGIYLPVIFNVKDGKKVLIITFLASLNIEIYQAVFSFFGLVFIVRTTNVDDLILNTLVG
ncbi:VanZ family protein [Serpentinicella alkaliphila]|uniref:VanZ family protein n=1 Tax=Serpentinicella alkaliphila TaxID=1734049 RepID=UPI001A9B45DE